MIAPAGTLVPAFYLVKFVHTRSSVSGRPIRSFPRTMLFIRNTIFLASTRITCRPSASTLPSPDSRQAGEPSLWFLRISIRLTPRIRSTISMAINTAVFTGQIKA